MTTLILHAGIHKTGSTAIQDAFAAHRGALATAGLHYPEATDDRTGHHDFALALLGRLPDESRGEAVLDYYADELERASAAGHDLLLSSEELEYALTVEPLEALRGRYGDGVSFVLYVDRQDRIIEREYNQHVKQADIMFPGGIMEFVLRHDFDWRLNYHRAAWEVQQVFGQGAARFRLYDRSRLSGGDVVADFLDTLGLTGVFAPESGPVNPSLSAPALELVRRLNLEGVSGDTRDRIVERVLRVDEGDWCRASPLGSSVREALMSRFAPGNARFFELLGEENPWTGERCAAAVADGAGPPCTEEFGRFVVALLRGEA